MYAKLTDLVFKIGVTTASEMGRLSDQPDGNPTYSDKEYIVFDNDYQFKPFKFTWKKLMAYAGPGLLMSIAYLDPGNIAGDLDAGVQGGYKLIWVLLWSTVLGLWYQSMSARLGVVTQRNLAKLSA